VSLVDVFPRLAAATLGGDRLPTTARAEPGFQLGGELPVEVRGEQRFAVWRAADAGGSEPGARVLDGVVGELREGSLWRGARISVRVGCSL
jgi:hypothetical protein